MLIFSSFEVCPIWWLSDQVWTVSQLWSISFESAFHHSQCWNVGFLCTARFCGCILLDFVVYLDLQL